MTATLTCTGPAGAATQADLHSYLTPELRDAARTETNRWIKRLRLVDYAGQSMRERFTYRGDSLWWFTELYLQKMRRLDAAVATVLALEAAYASLAPARMTLTGADEATTAAAMAFGRAKRLPVETAGIASPGGRRWPGYLVGLSARLSRLRPARRFRPGRSPKIAAFVHTAFWSTAGEDVDNPQHERYIGATLDAVAKRLPVSDLFLVGVGPRRNFRARRWWDPMTPSTGARPPVVEIERFATKHDLDGAMDLWRRRETLAREVTAGDGIRAAAEFRGCDLWPVLCGELARAATIQWTWSARAMDEAAAALDALRPAVALTYAEAGGWGRALVLEARRRGVQSVGLQHGFIYRHWLNYLHEADEIGALGSDRGCPIPDRTLVFDRYAADHLEHAGRFAPARVVITGNARLDDLARSVAACTDDDKRRVRARLGVATGSSMALLAAKFSEIRDQLPALAAAVDAMPGVRLVIKPHPAETPSVYAALASGRSGISIAPPDLDLAVLVSSCDALVTMNSTVAIDGLSLGVPSLVIGLPNNLSPFVDAGVMLGAADAAAIRAGLEALLYDREVRQRLARRAESFLDRYAMRPTGDGAARTADEILRLAH